MFKVILLARKKGELSYKEFRSYYSNHHVPMINALLDHGAAVHRRNFVQHPDPSDPGEYDVISEVFYEDRTVAEAAARALKAPEVHRQRIEDEARFLDPASVRVFMVEVDETVFRAL